MLIFTDDGRCFWLKVHEIPQAGRAAKGKPIVNMINVSPETKVSAIVTVRDFPDDQFLLFATKHGTVKKTSLSQYSNPRATGIKAIKIEDGRRADRRAGDRAARTTSCSPRGTACRSASTSRTCARWVATRPA